jgi:DNA-binding winged helix-turn-helix (wHTH) protein/Tol biopolymer transport system component
MTEPPLRFRDFELDPTQFALRRAGHRVRLERKPLELLILLVEKRGDLVAREEIIQRVWGNGVFFDAERGINNAIRKIRAALHDESGEPHFVETIVGKGYRFIAPINGATTATPSPNGGNAVAPAVLVDSAENLRDVETIPRPGYRFIGTVTQPSAASIAVPKPSAESELETAAPRHWRLVTLLPLIVRVATKHKVGLGAGILVILTLIAATAYGIHSILHNRHAIPFQNFEITQLTTNGKTALAAISPDGKYLVTVAVDNGKSSLLLRHIQTNSDTQVIPPAEVSYGGLAFSPDGNYIYFLKFDEYDDNDLFRVPVLGGTPQLLAKDIDTNPVFSPGGDRIAFGRLNDPELNKYRLIVANSDGTEERVVARGPMPNALSVAWLSNRKQIFGIQSVYQSPAAGSSLVSFDVATGQENSLAAFDDLLVDMAPAPVEDGFLVLYRSKAQGFRSQQIGFVSLSASKLWPVTRDTNNYATMTLSADRKTLATVQWKDDAGLYLLPTTSYGANPPNQVLAQEDDISDFAWASNTELYIARRSGLIRASIDGSSNIPLILDPHATISHIASCVPGRFAAFAWAGHGDSRSARLWRVDADGSSPKQIVNNENYDAVEPVCSPDGKWLYYQEGASGTFRVSTEDGTRQPIAGTVSPGFSNGFLGPDVSFDGKLLAFNVEKPVPLKPEMFDEMLVIVSLDSGAEPSTRMIEAIHGIGSSPRFTPDGRALVYAILENTGFETDNLWLQPLDGAPGRRITNFTSGRIRRIQFSPDGQRLGILRIHTKSDVVLLHDTGASSQ